ncbi:MAG: FecR family protein [Bacteroidetes bacterium]|nr:FecR family protein [Bacteroidota bacterium]
MNKKEIENLLRRYLADNVSAEEKAVVENWYISQFTNMNFSNKEEEQAYLRMKQNIQKRIVEQPVVSMYPKLKKLMAIAAILLVIIGSYWVYTIQNPKTKLAPITAKNDLASPQSSKAVITLADGTKLPIDSLSNGTLAVQNNISIVKNKNGEIVYSNTTSTNTNTETYNTLYNPRGSKMVALTLNDGTKVWLNSESSLKYPVAFAGNYRQVEITGEAYFEVEHNKQHPFKVKLPNGFIIEDIGTAFNINTYTDEPFSKATLIEGKVDIYNSSTPNQSTISLIPGYQASFTGASLENIKVKNVEDEIEEVTAWKNGLFHFENADIKTILRQFARWYDLDISYAGEIKNKKFFAIIHKNSSLNEVIKALQASSYEFELKGKELTVRNK